MSSDEKHPDVVCAKADGVRWRVFELECCQKYFGLTVNGRPRDVTVDTIKRCGAKTMIWKLHTECTQEDLWQHCCKVADGLPDVKHINDPRGWLNAHAKDRAFEVWEREGIPTPRWFEFKDEMDFWEKCCFSYPMLLRLNNSTTGYHSFLANNETQAKEALRNLRACRSVGHDGVKGTGTRRKFIAVEYIDTIRPENVNMSFRIIVAANKVVTGYARLGPATDWIAITNRFESHMEPMFVKYQKVCQKFCEDNADLLVKSVRCLGLNFQGVDVILDQNNKPYFLEVQPGFSVGYAEVKAWKPPFYNPSRPEALVRFLLREKDRLQEEIPLYYNCWLDKYRMFDTAYGALREQLYG